MTTRFDALVVGGGPAGSTVALLLAGAGWSVALLEKQAFPRRKVCGECIAAGNLALLDALGLGPRFAALAGPELRKVELHAGGECMRASLPPLAGPHPWGRALGREHLDALLLERAGEAGVQVFQPWSVRRVIRERSGLYAIDAAKADATLRLCASAVVLAHGSWSARPALSSANRPATRDSDLFAFKANFVDTTLEPGVLPVLAFAGGYGGMVIAEKGLATLACCIRRDSLAACRRQAPGATAGEAVEAYLTAACVGVASALRGARREGGWLAVGPLRPGLRSPDPRPAVFAVGNAAGEAHPIVGEGISMALQSAWLLGRRLIAGGPDRDAAAWHTAGKRHAAEWRRYFAPRIRTAAVCPSRDAAGARSAAASAAAAPAGLAHARRDACRKGATCGGLPSDSRGRRVAIRSARSFPAPTL